MQLPHPAPTPRVVMVGRVLIVAGISLCIAAAIAIGATSAMQPGHGERHLGTALRAAIGVNFN